MGKKILTFEQKNIFDNFLKSKEPNISFIAPTSYGKSELIFEHILKNNQLANIGIIVPTKSLIDQVYKDSKKIKGLNRKLIIHDQNFDINKDKRILAIVTQERALRLIEKNLTFDLIYVDEAHEIMDFNYRNDDSNRGLLLSRLLYLAKNINEKLIIMYLSPIINNTKNIQLKNQEAIQMNKIYRNLKLLNIYYLDSDKNLSQYDKFLGDFIKMNTSVSYSKYIINKSLEKNLHFLYRPIFIEQYADLLYEIFPETDDVPVEIENLINELKLIVHPKFKIIKYLTKGILYIHGKMPLIIRNYLMKFVQENDYIKHFIANSVILAGMNMPIDNLFYISGFKNNYDLQNLIGRVNRLNEIFKKDNNNLSKIFIPVHFLELEDFPQYQGGNIKKKIENLRKNLKDDVRNPLLKNAKITKKNRDAAKKIENAEMHIIENHKEPDFYTRLMIAGAQQILKYNKKGYEKLELKIKRKEKIEDNQILDSIKELFFDEFDDSEFTPQYNALRLSHVETISYYKMFISDLNKLPLNQRIEKTVKYWLKRKNENYKVYVGGSFGEEQWDTSYYHNGRKVYVNIDRHINDSDYLYNLALIKLQIDEEFLGHEITLLINTLLEFELITQTQFDKFIYGTDSEDELQALQLGISRNIFLQLKKDKQISNIEYDNFENPRASNDLKNYIQKQKGIVKFELEKYFL